MPDAQVLEKNMNDDATDNDELSLEAVDIEGFPVTRPIVLVGLMGAGKTSVGIRLAKTLNIPFIDSDVEIVAAAGCSISDIFEIYGEEKFRDLEKRVMLRLLNDASPSLIATGGGAFLNAEIRQAVQEKAVSLWLQADLEVLLERVSRKKNRPLLEKGDKRQILSELMSTREPVYMQAHVEVDSGTGTHECVVKRAVEALRPFFEDK